MSNLNRIILVGTVSENPETKFGMENNSSMSKFTLAVNRPAKQDGTYDMDYIPVVTWGKQADYAAEHLKQNSIVLVEGKIQNRAFEKNGQRTWITEVSASTLRLLQKDSGNNPGSREDNLKPKTVQEENAGPTGEGLTEDDVPF